MIPGDLAARLRLLTEASFFETDPPLGPLQPVKGVPSQLPEYRPGDRFTALIQKALPDGTFEALVDGRSIKLALPQSAQAGDRLELVVARNTPRAVLAHAADAPADTTTRAALSPTGRLISFLLTGQPAPETPTLARGQPLLPGTTMNPTLLAPALRQAISESGLFYESHLARWTAGNHSTAALLREPQAQLAARAGAGPQGPAASLTPAATSTGDNAAQAARSATQAAAAPIRAELVPERLLPVMHQQLDALATHHYAWTGQAWPGQDMAIEIEDPNEREGDGSGDEAGPAWKTTLRLTLPALGGIEARLSLNGPHLRLHLGTDSHETANTLAANRRSLNDALARAKLTLDAFEVGIDHGTP